MADRALLAGYPQNVSIMSKRKFVYAIFFGFDWFLCLTVIFMYEDLHAGSRFQEQGQVITFRSICGIWLLAPRAWCLPLAHNSSLYVKNIIMTSSYKNIFRVTGPWVENSPVTDEFPAKRPVTRSFDVFFDLRPNKLLSKQSWGWWFRRHHAHYDITVMSATSFRLLHWWGWTQYKWNNPKYGG